MKTLQTIDEVNAQKQSAKPTVFLWSANWCPDCLYLMPYLDALEKANPDMDFYKLDRDQLLDEAIAEEILGIPSLVVYEEGQEKGRFVSKLRKTPEEIQAFLDSLKK